MAGPKNIPAAIAGGGVLSPRSKELDDDPSRQRVGILQGGVREGGGVLLDQGVVLVKVHRHDVLDGNHGGVGCTDDEGSEEFCRE